MNFFIGFFWGFWLQIWEHLFSRTPFKWLLLQRRIQDLVIMELFCEYNKWLKAIYCFHKKAPSLMFHKVLCTPLLLCSEVTSSIYQTHKFKVYCNSFWRHCNVFYVIFSHIKETLCPLSDVALSKNLEFLCNCMFATNAKTIIYVT